MNIYCSMNLLKDEYRVYILPLFITLFSYLEFSPKNVNIFYSMKPQGSHKSDILLCLKSLLTPVTKPLAGNSADHFKTPQCLPNVHVVNEQIFSLCEMLILGYGAKSKNLHFPSGMKRVCNESPSCFRQLNCLQSALPHMHASLSQQWSLLCQIKLWVDSFWFFKRKLHLIPQCFSPLKPAACNRIKNTFFMK